MATLQGEKEYDQALASDRPLSELKPFFMDWESVLEHHTDEMTLKYSPHVNDSRCQGCAQHPSSERFLFSWRARYHTGENLKRSAFISMFTVFLGSLRHEYSIINFPTYHHLCQDCSRFIRFRNFIGQFISYVSTWVFWLALIAFICALMTGIYFISTRFGASAHPRTSWRDILGTLGYAAAFAGLIFATLRGRRLRSRLGVPAGIRKIAKEPFHLQSISRL